MGDGRENYLDDRISHMPNEILACIISWLTIKEVASTSVLPKRWQYLWPFSNGSLDLDGSKKKREDPWFLEVEQSKYVRWVNQVLELHQGSTIDEFIVCFWLDSGFKSSIDKWIDLAIAKRAKRLELNLKTYEGSWRAPEPDECYVYLQSPHGLSSIKFLRSLSLKFINVTGEILKFFLSSCPLVERSCVHNSEHLVNLKVACSSLQLKYLEIDHCKYVNIVEICAPNLVQFKYFGPRFELRIQNAPLLVDVSFGGPYEPENTQLPQCELSKLRDLTLRIDACDSDSLLGLTCLIRASPLLHRFMLELSWNGPCRRREIWTAPKCCHRHLKVVEFVGFVGCPVDLELAMYLLQNAIMLKKIIINPNLWEPPGSFRNPRRN